MGSITAPLGTSAVDLLIGRVVQREAGFVNNPADRGGATNYGITIGTLRDWRRAPVGVEDVRNLTIEEAEHIYKTNYFTATGFDQVSDPQLQELLFDFAVNSGVGAASKALQRSIGVKDDGAIGPITLAALKAVTNMAALFYRVKCERYELLLRFIGSDAEEGAFAIGWANRQDQFEHQL
jgi:lysozyme family protein